MGEDTLPETEVEYRPASSDNTNVKETLSGYDFCTAYIGVGGSELLLFIV